MGNVWLIQYVIRYCIFNEHQLNNGNNENWNTTNICETTVIHTRILKTDGSLLHTFVTVELTDSAEAFRLIYQSTSLTINLQISHLGSFLRKNKTRSITKTWDKSLCVYAIRETTSFSFIFYKDLHISKHSEHSSISSILMSNASFLTNIFKNCKYILNKHCSLSFPSILSPNIPGYVLFTSQLLKIFYDNLHNFMAYRFPYWFFFHSKVQIPDNILCEFWWTMLRHA